MSTHPFNPQPDAAPAPVDDALDMGTADETTAKEPAAEAQAEEPADETPVEETAAEAQAEEPAVEPENVGAKVAKRAPTNLEADVLTVCRSYAAGTVVLPEGKQLTPHAISKFVEANRGDGETVSTGAVSDCLKRWDNLGFVNLTEKPVAFDTFVGGNTQADLDALKQARKEALAAERAAKREAAKAAKEAEKAAETPAEEPASDDESTGDPVAESVDAPNPGF